MAKRQRLSQKERDALWSFLFHTDQPARALEDHSSIHGLTVLSLYRKGLLWNVTPGCLVDPRINWEGIRAFPPAHQVVHDVDVALWEHDKTLGIEDTGPGVYELTFGEPNPAYSGA